MIWGRVTAHQECLLRVLGFAVLNPTYGTVLDYRGQFGKGGFFKMKVTVTALVVLVLLALDGFTQEYTRWHLPEGAKLRLGKGAVTQIAYSPDGAQIAVATTFGVWLYDAETYKETALLTAEKNWVESMAFSLDGEMIAAGISAWDAAVHLWNAKTGEHLFTITGDFRTVTCVAFSPDGKTLASGSGEEVWLWDVETGAHLRTLRGHPETVVSVAFSPDGSVIVIGGGYRDGALSLWDVNTGRNLWTRAVEGRDIRFVAFNRDGQTLLSGGRDGTMSLWEVAKGKFLTEVVGSGRGDFAIAYNAVRQIIDIVGPRGKGLWGGTVVHPPVHSIRGKWFISTLAISPDGETLAFAGDGGLVHIWDTETGGEKHVFTDHTDGTTGLAFGKDSKMIASASNGMIILWDTDTGERLRTFSDRWKYVDSVAFNQEKGIIAGGSRGEIHLWDVSTGELLNTLIGVRGEYRSLEFSADGRLLANGAGSSVQLWDVETSERLHILLWHTSEITSLAFSRDGDTLAVGSRDHSVTLWDVETGERQRTLSGHNDEVVSVAFSRDGRFFASATSRALLLWNTLFWTNLTVQNGNAHEDSNIAFSPDSKMIARGGYDATVRLWNTATGGLEHSFTDHGTIITSVAFSPDGRTLASGSLDGAVLLWEFVSSPVPVVSSTVSIMPADVMSPRVGEQFTLSLDITAGEDVVGYQASVNFDSTALRYVEAASGDYLPADGFFLSQLVKEDSVTLGGTSFAGASEGDGTLATLTFEVLAVKPSSLTLSNVNVVNSKKERGFPDIVDGQVIEPPPRVEDVNRDGEVNLLDLVQVAINLDKIGENDADVNGDGMVNLFDLVQVAGAIE